MASLSTDSAGEVEITTSCLLELAAEKEVYAHAHRACLGFHRATAVTGSVETTITADHLMGQYLVWPETHAQVEKPPEVGEIPMKPKLASVLSSEKSTCRQVHHVRDVI